jgi:hypothetical protein
MSNDEYIDLPAGKFYDCDPDYQVFDLTEDEALPHKYDPKPANSEESDNVRRHQLEDDGLSID